MNKINIAKKFNVAGQKYTDAMNDAEDRLLEGNGELVVIINDINKLNSLITGLRRDLDSTAKIQGNMLDRETKRLSNLEIT